MIKHGSSTGGFVGKYKLDFHCRIFSNTTGGCVYDGIQMKIRLVLNACEKKLYILLSILHALQRQTVTSAQ